MLEDAIKAAPERAYLTFDRLVRAYAAGGQPDRFEQLCERLIRRAAARLARAGGPRPAPARGRATAKKRSAS